MWASASGCGFRAPVLGWCVRITRSECATGRTASASASLQSGFRLRYRRTGICSAEVVQPRTHHPDPHFVADYPGGSLPFVPLTVPLAEARRLFMTDFSEPSSIRVFGKSLHWLAAGWTVAIWWLWLASINQSLVRRNVMPDNYAISILIAGFVSALAIEAAALLIGRSPGRGPRTGLERREWRIAFWWSAVPNALLFLTVYVMIEATR